MPSVNLALWILPFALPIALWVAYTDLKFMKIRNTAVLAMAGVWILLGWPAVGRDLWLWSLAIMAIVLALGFLGNMVGMFGAGDAKFAAAMSGVFVGGDPWFIALLYVSASLVTFICHRIVRRIPAVTRATPGWVSWESRKFPMGLALGLMLIVYLLAAFLPNS